jgi:hypothetical protein
VISVNNILRADSKSKKAHSVVPSRSSSHGPWKLTMRQRPRGTPPPPIGARRRSLRRPPPRRHGKGVSTPAFASPLRTPLGGTPSSFPRVVWGATFRGWGRRGGGESRAGWTGGSRGKRSKWSRPWPHNVFLPSLFLYPSRCSGESYPRTAHR